MKKKHLRALCLSLLIASSSALGWISIAKANLDKSNFLYKTTISTGNNSHELFENYLNSIYSSANLAESDLDQNLFTKAVTGYFNLKSLNKISSEKEIITILDFTKPSREKRLWVIDLSKKVLLFHTLVAHGKGSGNDQATSFSNVPQSNQSSLGFYATGEIYYGKHARSLKLDGLDAGFNTNARNRAIVIHGAEYVSQQFINLHGRLGRSQGCPAIPIEVTNAIIDAIKDKTCLFISGADNSYASAYMDQQGAADYVSKNLDLAKVN